MNGLLTRLRLTQSSALSPQSCLSESEADGHATGATPAKTAKPVTGLRLRAELRLRDRARRKRHEAVMKVLMVIALGLVMVRSWQLEHPDPAGPALTTDPRYGELHRHVSVDPHEDCLVFKWVNAAGETKIRHDSCPR